MSHFLAKCCKRRLNHGSCFAVFCIVCFCVIFSLCISVYILVCLSVSVKWLAVKTASEMTKTVSGGVLISTPTSTERQFFELVNLVVLEQSVVMKFWLDHHNASGRCMWDVELGRLVSLIDEQDTARSSKSTNDKCTGWRLQSGLHSNNQSSCTSVYTGPHLHTLLTSFIRWQMSRLVSDSVPVHPHHWLSAAPDSLPSVTELSLSPLHVSVTSAPSVAVFRSRLKAYLFNISYPCDCTVPAQWL